MTYAEKLKDPRWQKKRLEIMKRDGWKCRYCESSDKSLVVHHVVYENNHEPWEYDDWKLLTLCEDCHSIIHTRDELLEANIEIISDLLRGSHKLLLSFQIASLIVERIKGNVEFTIPKEGQVKLSHCSFKIPSNGKAVH